MEATDSPGPAGSRQDRLRPGVPVTGSSQLGDRLVAAQPALDVRTAAVEQGSGVAVLVAIDADEQPR